MNTLVQLNNIYLDPIDNRVYIVYNNKYIELCTVNNLGFTERIGYGGFSGFGLNGIYVNEKMD